MSSKRRINSNSCKVRENRLYTTRQNDKYLLRDRYNREDEQRSVPTRSSELEDVNHVVFRQHGAPPADVGGGDGGMRRSRSVPDFRRASSEMLRERGMEILSAVPQRERGMERLNAVRQRDRGMEPLNPVPQRERSMELLNAVLQRDRGMELLNTVPQPGRGMELLNTVPQTDRGMELFTAVPQRTAGIISVVSQGRIGSLNATRIVVLSGEKKRYGFSLVCIKDSNRHVLPTSNDMTYPKITAVIKKSLAHNAGLRPSDVIIEINGTNVANASLERCLQLMKEERRCMLLKVFTPEWENNNNRISSGGDVKTNLQPKTRTVLARIRSVPKKWLTNQESSEVGFVADASPRLHYTGSQKHEKRLVDDARKLSVQGQYRPCAVIKTDSTTIEDSWFVKKPVEPWLKRQSLRSETQNVLRMHSSREKITESNKTSKVPYFRRAKEPAIIQKIQTDCISTDEDCLKVPDVTRRIFFNDHIRSELPIIASIKSDHQKYFRTNLNSEQTREMDEFIAFPARLTIIESLNKSGSERINLRDDDSGINGSVIDGEYDALLCGILKASTQELNAQQQNGGISEISESDESPRQNIRNFGSKHVRDKNSQEKQFRSVTELTKVDNHSFDDGLDNFILPPPPEFCSGT